MYRKLEEGGRKKSMERLPGIRNVRVSECHFLVHQPVPISILRLDMRAYKHTKDCLLPVRSYWLKTSRDNSFVTISASGRTPRYASFREQAEWLLADKSVAIQESGNRGWF